MIKIKTRPWEITSLCPLINITVYFPHVQINIRVYQRGKCNKEYYENLLLMEVHQTSAAVPAPLLPHCCSNVAAEWHRFFPTKTLLCTSRMSKFPFTFLTLQLHFLLRRKLPYSSSFIISWCSSHFWFSIYELVLARGLLLSIYRKPTK